jgi:hypothetical protein
MKKIPIGEDESEKVEYYALVPVQNATYNLLMDSKRYTVPL